MPVSPEEAERLLAAVEASQRDLTTVKVEAAQAIETATAARLIAVRAAVAADVPRAEIARRLGVTREYLYQLLKG